MKKHPLGLLSMLMAIMLIVTGCPSEPVAVTSVTLDRTEISIAIGSSVKLTATIAPADAEVGTEIIWTSSNPEIVEVDRDGNATAKSLGEATITVKTANGLTATCKVTVVPVMATKLTLSKETLEMVVDSEETLTVTFTPSNTTDRTIEWASSNPEVAKVENGKITALKEGEAVISASTANGLTATCKVTVVPVMATKISLSRETLEMEVSSEETLTVTFTPSNTTDRTIEWSSSDPEIAKVENGKITALKEGEAVISARTVNGIEAKCKVKVVPIKATAISFMADTYILEKEETYIEDGLYFTPEDTADKSVTWSSSDESVVSINEDGTFTCHKIGTATITARHGELEATCTFEIVDYNNYEAGKLYENLKSKGIHQQESLRIAGSINSADFRSLVEDEENIRNLDLELCNVTGNVDGKPGPGNTSIESFTFPRDMDVIPDNCFSDYSSIRTIVLPEKLKTIGKRAFSNLSNLTDIELPEGIETIGEGAFIGTGLKEMTIPSTVTSMTDSWPALTAITFNGTIPPDLIVSTDSGNKPTPPDRTWMTSALVHVPTEAEQSYMTSEWFTGEGYEEAQSCFSEENLNRN